VLLTWQAMEGSHALAPRTRSTNPRHS
jgi:hypothetical protein